VIGADGALSQVAANEVAGGDEIPYVIAYHEIIAAPEPTETYDPKRCDVIYDGQISPDFYGWIFPHGNQASIGMGSWQVMPQVSSHPHRAKGSIMPWPAGALPRQPQRPLWRQDA